MMSGVAIESAGRARLADVVNFIRSWSEDDSYERFGILGSHAPEWLATELCGNNERHAIIAVCHPERRREAPQSKDRLKTNARCDPSTPLRFAQDDTRVIGLLDHIETAGAVHFGVAVDARYRRLYVGTELVNELLRVKARDRAVAAECRLHNRAAIALLRGCGFERVAVHRDEISWCHR